MKRKRWISLMGIPVAGISSLVTGLVLAALLPPLPAFSFNQSLLITWRGGDSLPSTADQQGSAAPMYYTTPLEGAHEEGGLGLRATGVWAPGDEVTRTLMVKNVGTDYMMLLDSLGVRLTGDLEIAPLFDLTVTTQEGRILWSGGMDEFTASEKVPFAEPVAMPLGNTQALSFRVHLDPSTGNSLQGKSILADFIIHGREYALDMGPEMLVRWPINPGAKGEIQVRLRDREGFDVTELDWSTARFGPNWIPPSRPASGGDKQMVLHFDSELTGITCGMTEVRLRIATYSGLVFELSDEIKTPPCPDG